MKKAAKISIIVILVLAVFIMMAIPAFNLYLEYSQIKETGARFTQVFWINMRAKLIVSFVSFLIVFAVLYISFSSVKMTMMKIDSDYNFLKKRYLIFLISLFFSFIISNIFQFAVAEKMLFFLNPSFVNIGDPLFFKDIGYYFFQRPFLTALFDSLLYLSVIITVIVFLSYALLSGRLGLSAIKEVMKSKGIVFHNLINIGFVVLIKTISYIFKAEEILYSSNSGFFGAGFTDVSVMKLYFSIIPWILVLISAAAVILIKNNKIKYGLISLAVYPLTYIVFLVAGLFVQTFVVNPQEVAIESPYLSNNIRYTRMAYNINDVDKKEYEISYSSDEKVVNEASETLSDIRIIDFSSTRKAVNQLQGIRNYYDFSDIDIVKYNINGKESAVALGAREINLSNLPSGSKTFLNEKMRFTHGYGIVALKINEVTKEGQPSFIVKDIPPVSYEGFPEITQPRIYFGEAVKGYSIVNSGYKELDYSMGETDNEFSYDGKAGIKMNFLNRLVYSIHCKDFKLLISGLITKDSRLLINKNVSERVRIAAPFLTVSDDPYILADKEGDLKWIVDCFTTSSLYPYSQPVEFKGNKVNYIRNSVKAVVDAYDGTLQFYITDETDPLVQTYKRIYPGFFEETSFPEDLKEHIVYPEELFKIQAEIFKRYHVSDAGVFYNNTDSWDIAREKYQNESKYLDPYYSYIKTENGNRKMILMLPYTMTGKDNLVAWLGVDNDFGSNKMVLYTFPKGENVYGTMQIENRIDNDPAISKELTLWNQGGSNVIRGNMLVIPVGNSLMYAEPIYISSGESSSIPELKRIILSYGEKIVMAENMNKALEMMFDNPGSSYEPAPPSETPEEQEEIQPSLPEEDETKRIVELFDKSKEAMKQGDWQSFGNNYAELEKEIDKLRKKEE